MSEGGFYQGDLEVLQIPLGSTKTGSLGKSYITSAMASKACVMRLGKEHQRLGKEPVPNIEAEPR